MAFSTSEFLNSLDTQIQSQHLLLHDFYLAWSKGELSEECLADYALNYYGHVLEFPKYLSALHSHTKEANTRREILKNLMEEEYGTPNHPELWRDFIYRFGVSDQQIDQHEFPDEIQHLISTFKDICSNKSTAEGIAALYAYESQIPAVSQSKIDGLKTHYGMQHPENWTYFSVHITADKEHAAVERNLLESYVSAENAEAVTESTQRVLDALNGFLTAMCHKHGIACTA